jgi:hypothetical protein
VAQARLGHLLFDISVISFLWGFILMGTQLFRLKPMCRSQLLATFA